MLKIALTRRIFQPKMHQIAFGGRALPGPAGGADSAPRSPSWIKGSLHPKEGSGKGRKEEGRRRRDVKEMKGEVKGGNRGREGEGRGR